MLNKVNDSYNRKAYKEFINYLRFPKYKNFIEDTIINFAFPISVFVGKNGSGKSSILKVLYGCVDGKSLGDYWFSTKVDSIFDDNGSRNCFIYNYVSKENKDIDYEVLCQRAPRKDNPDYWETARPVVKYKMKKHPTDTNYRRPKIKNNCLYVDFHSLLSAFDVYRYFAKKELIKDTNAFLRRKSFSLKKCIDENLSILYRGKKHSDQPIILSHNELKVIGDILGKKYDEIKIIKHRFFLLWGSSIQIKSNHSYTEAFAGSGETAIILLVHALNNMPKNSLILLDEPEVCLHPGAQKKLFEYIVDICYKNQHQIIISTHSSEFVSNLPDQAIKLFLENSENKIDVINECSNLSAFVEIGKDIDSKKMIIVEDKLAEFIMNKVVENMTGNIDKQLEFKYVPGGEGYMKKMLYSFCQLKEKDKFLLFDGDQKKKSMKLLKDFTKSEAEDVSFWKGYILKLTGLEANVIIQQDSNDADKIKISRYENYVKLYESNVFFLPKQIPEEIIWDENYLESLVSEVDIQNEIKSQTDYKTKFKLVTNYLKGEETATSIFDTQKMFVNKWIKRKDETFDDVNVIINSILAR